jgi:hypothetical protein
VHRTLDEERVTIVAIEDQMFVKWAFHRIDAEALQEWIGNARCVT